MTPDELLAGLNDEQGAAAQLVTGPVAIHAGAGTGKTRVIAHRTTYAATIGAVRPDSALLLTFTDKAAAEMSQRLLDLGLPGVATMTFHKAAWRQLRHFWPQLYGDRLGVLDQPWRIVSPAIRRLPGHYRFAATKDVLDTISWVNNSRVDTADLDRAARDAERVLPLPADLLARVIDHYTRSKARQQVVDFDDMILRTTDLLREHPTLLAQVRDRYRWFSVDEFQDTNPAQFELLRLWLGDRQDLCVVGDPQQTIYSFTGATDRFLTGFSRWFPSARTVELTRNYRSTPQILGLANRLFPARPGLRATRPVGPKPRIEQLPDAAEELGELCRSLAAWRAEGVAFEDMAVLVRLNEDIPPIEAALTRSGIPFLVRGTAFFQRREIRAAIRALSAVAADDEVLAACDRILTDEFGYDAEDDPDTPAARDRHAALGTLRDLVVAHAPDGLSAVIAELERRAVAESAHSGAGVTLTTLHGAKGLEWQAVVLPGLEQGRLPVKQALKSPEQVAEERRLLYVGITRARRHLLLTRALHRTGGKGKVVTRQASQFLRDLVPQAQTAVRDHPPVRSRAWAGAERPVTSDGPESDLFGRLRRWRRDTAEGAGVPAYVVFPDSTLALIARDRPGTLNELAAVHGVGPTKLERYGEQVLAIVQADS